MKIKFILTGSSARKLKRGSANLLAGRAFKYVCHPLTHIELETEFKLQEVLQLGALPEIFSLSTDENSKITPSFTFFKILLRKKTTNSDRCGRIIIGFFAV